jgi:hypothetical protein
MAGLTTGLFDRAQHLPYGAPTPWGPRTNGEKSANTTFVITQATIPMSQHLNLR